MALGDSPIMSQEDIESRNEPLPDQRRRARMQACIGCRNSKIRCISIAGQSSCQACERVNRECVMPGPPKQRTRTSHRIAGLERKIEMLTDALLAQSQQSTPTAIVTSLTGETINNLADEESLSTFEQRTRTDTVLLTSGIPNAPMRLDLIDRGIIQLDRATILLDHWRHNMSIYLPVVNLSNTVTAQDLRKSKPMVFLAVLVVASASIQPSLLSRLLMELNQQLAERVLITGEKSMDLVQALLLYTTHFVVPTKAMRSSYTQYVHSAVSVSLDLGLDKSRQPEQHRIDVNDIRRTWLACYYTASK